ncbi:DsrH like protein [Acinetobacter sp.]|uniref:DsrH like protein n=1 Tax=Acinetobacter sp. TaxID=472 RepID=UPI0028375B70|nr:DsrH like protein [Acinetobacter sp.]MDR2249214.1 DsrH like protein [Acinetobacter sp.]
MTQSTLYLVQASYQHTPQIIQELEKLFDKDDQIVFMGDSTAQLSVSICLHFGSVSCLAHEKDLIDAEILAHVKVLNYDQFADLVLKFNRCISLK